MVFIWGFDCIYGTYWAGHMGWRSRTRLGWVARYHSIFARILFISSCGVDIFRLRFR